MPDVDSGERRPAAFLPTSEMIVFSGREAVSLATEELAVHVPLLWSGLARPRSSHDAPALGDSDEVAIRLIVS
jgi:hypothetical protein